MDKLIAILIFLFASLFALQPVVAEECEKPEGHVRISAVGDILVHEALFRQAIRSQAPGFRRLWADLIPTLQDADLTVGNLEGPVAPGVIRGGREFRDPGAFYDGKVYSGTNFVFNYHPSLLPALRSSGFDLLTTANNHSLDRGALGVDRTIEQLNAAELDFVGTRKSNSDERRGLVVQVKSYRVGVVSCTEMVNGMPDPKNQVLRCSSPEVIETIWSLRQRADAVIVFPHWGEEYENKPNKRQRSWANQWVRAGAEAVIGSHPHVLQTVEWIPREDGSKALVIYSLGNFVAAQKALEKRVSAIAHLDLHMTSAGLRVGQFSYTPFQRPESRWSLERLKYQSAELRHATRQLGSVVCR